MDQTLESGLGEAKREAVIDLRVSPVAAMTGTDPDFLPACLKAVHAWNRRAHERVGGGERIAIAFPEAVLAPRPGAPVTLGGVVRLVGSLAALASFRDGPLLGDLVRRELVCVSRVLPYKPEGALSAFVRNRSSERLSPGRVRREVARRERAGLSIEPLLVKKARLETQNVPRTSTGVVTLDGKRIEIEIVSGAGEEAVDPKAPLLVSTYGLARRGTPSFVHLG